MKIRKKLIFFFTVAFIFLEIFSSYKVKSNLAQPPAGYVDNPPVNQACTYCHAGAATMSDSLNFLLYIGVDTSHLSILTTGVTTYTPGQTYYMRVQATKVHPRYGFELSADDGSGSGADVGSFAVLNTVNTSLVTNGPGGGSYIGHHNANTNNQWTFQWTAPSTNIGPITFYWAGNDANGDGTQEGDSIYIAKKIILASTGAAIQDISGQLTNVQVFPTISSGNIQLQFNLVNNNSITAELLTMSGQAVVSVVNETLSAGKYTRSLDVSNLGAGIYLLKLQVGDAYLVKKIIRQ